MVGMHFYCNAKPLNRYTKASMRKHAPYPLGKLPIVPI